MMKQYKLSELVDIGWKEDPTQFEYVREATGMCCRKNFNPVKNKKHKLIGIQKLSKPSEGVYHFKYYYLKDHDSGMPNEGRKYIPSEAVRIVK